MNVGLLGSADDLIHADMAVVGAVSDIVGDASIEEDGFLRDNSQLTTEPGNVEILHVLSTNHLDAVKQT